MKTLLKKAFARLLPSMRNELELELGSTFVENEQVAQKALMLQYRRLAAEAPDLLPSLSEAGFRKYSQFEEDGMLLLIFSLVAPINRIVVEICAGSGRECMAANLVINHGWRAHLFDGRDSNITAARRFFGRNKDTFFDPPKVTKAWITAENINELLAASGAHGPVDLLSLDIDGMDYWVWRAISAIDPQVIVCEIHNLIPPDKALTVPYDPAFSFDSEQYRGASLAAMTQLGNSRGYRLIGVHRFGFNAFFMKRGIGEGFFPEVTVAECLNNPVTVATRNKHWPQIKDLKWVDVADAAVPRG